MFGWCWVVVTSVTYLCGFLGVLIVVCFCLFAFACVKVLIIVLLALDIDSGVVYLVISVSVFDLVFCVSLIVGCLLWLIILLLVNLYLVGCVAVDLVYLVLFCWLLILLVCAVSLLFIVCVVVVFGDSGWLLMAVGFWLSDLLW